MATSVIDNKEQKLLRMEKYEGTQLTRRAVPHIAEARLAPARRDFSMCASLRKTRLRSL